MTKIDFTQTVTVEDQAALDALARAEAQKAECRTTILAALSESTQTNISQAVAAYTATLVRGGDKPVAEAATGLSDADFTLIEAGRRWIAQMQAECRRAISTGDDPVWPVLPEGVEVLAAAF